MKLLQMFMIAAGLIVAFGQPLGAQDRFNNDRALEGLSQSKVYFDVSLDDDKKLALRMDLVNRTVQQIKNRVVDVSAVIGFRGGASRFITSDDHYVLEEEQANKVKIQEWVKSFANQGITIEQCSIAAELYNINLGDFMPEVTIVQNGYVSLVGYQNKGYAVVPMD